MNSIINDKIMKVLNTEFKKFKSYMLDENYEEFSVYDENKMFSLFMFSLINNKTALQESKKKCLKNNITEKEYNNLIYNTMKYIHKIERGCWSFHEITELNIPVEEIQELTLTYTIL